MSHQHPAAADGLVEAVLSDREYARVADALRKLAGIVLEPHKRHMAASRLSRRLRACGDASFSAYLDRLDVPGHVAERQEFVNALTTNLTSLFREAHHFDHLRQTILTASANERNRRWRIWSAGCSTGEEPYSIAMTALDAFGTLPSDFLVLATDLDTEVLKKAREGIYSAERFADLPKRSFRGLSKLDRDRYAMPDELKAAIVFRQLNLVEEWPMHGPFDHIFCRNVMIYFSDDTKARLVEKFADMLAPNGFLYLGHSEAVLGTHPKLESCGRTIYRRREAEI